MYLVVDSFMVQKEGNKKIMKKIKSLAGGKRVVEIFAGSSFIL
jgi:hypothetical protein